MKRNPLSDEQRHTLRCVYQATIVDAWYRARSSGERVTLASLYRKGLLTRRTWRGQPGEANAAHEYQLSDLVIEKLRKTR
jgi:hypothetical protein